MQVRPTVMSMALLQAALRASSSEPGKKVIRHALTDDPTAPFKTGYNRPILNNICVSPKILNKIYK